MKSIFSRAGAVLLGLGIPIFGLSWAEDAPSPAAPAYQWSCVTASAPFAPRDGAGALVYRDAMWLLGGWNPGDKVHFPKICSNDVWRSTDGATWTLVKPNTFGTDEFDPETDWEGRHTAGYVVFQDKLWILGGDPLQGHYQSDVWNSEDGITWNRVNPGRDVPWAPRVLHLSAAFNGRIWILGGQTLPQYAPADERFYDDIWSSADGILWTKAAAAGAQWSPRGMIGGSAVLHGRLWLLGGGIYDTPQRPQREFYNDVWSSADGIHWQRHLEHAPWHPRQYHDVAVFDGRLWVLEGWNQENRNDVWHSADGVEWQELPGTPWAPRHASSLFVYQDALWVVAGNNMQSDVWKLERR